MKFLIILVLLIGFSACDSKTSSKSETEKIVNNLDDR